MGHCAFKAVSLSLSLSVGHRPFKTVSPPLSLRMYGGGTSQKSWQDGGRSKQDRLKDGLASDDRGNSKGVKTTTSSGVPLPPAGGHVTAQSQSLFCNDGKSNFGRILVSHSVATVKSLRLRGREAQEGKEPLALRARGNQSQAMGDISAGNKKNPARKETTRGKRGRGRRSERDTEESESMCFVPLAAVIHPSYLIV